jgi:hypothetical protein
MRPLTDVNDLVAKLLEIYNNPEEARRRAENGYKWVTTKMEWQKNIVPQWVKLFDKAYKELNQKVSDVDKKKIIEAEMF